MPPRRRVEKDVILDKAFEMARSNGFESITARSLSASLGCSTQPIYQAFSDMKTLEKAVAEKSLAFMVSQMRTAVEAAALPYEAEFVLAYIKFALDETPLFRLVAQNGLFAKSAQSEDPLALPIDPKLIIFANGVIFMTVFQSLHWSWEEIRPIVISAYHDFYKENNGENPSMFAHKKQHGEEIR